MNLKNVLKRVSTVGVVLFFFSSTFAKADILDSWHWRNPSPFADTMRNVCFGGGKFVTVGNGGAIHSSTDGITWDAGSRPVVYDLNKVIYANGQYIAVGNSGSIATSPDGGAWTSRASAATNDFLAVTFGNGHYVACGAAGQLAISTDGVTWAVTNVGVADLSWITYGNGVFVLPTANQQMTVQVSSDLQTWTTATFPNSAKNSFDHYLLQAEFGNGVFVANVQDEDLVTAHTYQPASHFYYSNDGTNWAQGSSGGAFQGESRFFSLANGSFCNLATGGASDIFWTTQNGVTADWFLLPATFSDATALAFGSGRYVMVGSAGEIWNSMDLTNWIAGNDGGFRNQVVQIIGGQNNLVAFAGSLPVLVSSDGITFNAASNSPTGVLTTGYFDGTNYVGVGATVQISSPHSTDYTGEVYTSTNATDWVRRTSNANQPLYAICRGPSRWVAVGGAGAVTTSPNTLAWTLRSSGTGNDLIGVAFGNGIYVAVGNVGTVITSTDGTAWDVQFSGTTADLLSVKFLNGQFIATGRGGTIITSSDGVNWASQNSGTTASLFTVDYGYGSYLACGYDDVSNPSVGDIFLTSTDGTNWQNVSTKIPTATTARSVAFLNHSFWIVGDNGMILQSAAADGVPHLAGSKMSGNGGVKFKVTLNPPASYRVQFSTNVLTGPWKDIYTNTSPITSDTWTDTNAFQMPAGFYRVVSP